MKMLFCDTCKKPIGRIDFCWDSGNDDAVYCLDCKPLTIEEKNYLEYAQKIKRKQCGINE